MPPNINTVDIGKGTAPYLEVSAANLIAVEHPFIIRDGPKAVDTLGGAERVAQAIDNARDAILLKPRAGDAYSKSIESFVVPTENLLLRIETPKWTGRRRKKGSGLPFQTSTDTPPLRKEDIALRCLRDNTDFSEISVVGKIDSTHRFRDPPDFVWTTSTHPFLSRFKKTILSGSYADITDFQIDQDDTPGPLVPPPMITPSVTPWTYSYRQHVSAKSFETDGKKQNLNAAHHGERRVCHVRCDADTVPDPERPVLEASLAQLTPLDQGLVAQIRRLFERRPIWTRRGIRSQLKAEGRSQTSIENFIYAHVAYTFSSGPWRDALIRFGIDPRKDPEMRIYQVMSFRTDVMGPSRRTAGSANPKVLPASRGGQIRLHPGCPQPAPEQSHIFDGTSVDTSGKLLQACDVTDALVKTLLSTASVRDSCDFRGSGWYFDGTWGKAKAITKAKIRHLVETGQPLDITKNRQIQNILEIPDQITETNRQKARPSRAAGAKVLLRTVTILGPESRPSETGDRGRDTTATEDIIGDEYNSLAIDSPSRQTYSVNDEDDDGIAAVMQELEEQSDPHSLEDEDNDGGNEQDDREEGNGTSS